MKSIIHKINSLPIGKKTLIYDLITMFCHIFTVIMTIIIVRSVTPTCDDVIGRNNIGLMYSMGVGYCLLKFMHHYESMMVR